MFVEIEAGLAVVALALALLTPNIGSRWFEAIERSFGKLAKRLGLSVVTIGLTALALRVALLPILPVPVPGVSDEYSYLLLSDTFAHGRLANPTNPMWVHFETFQVIWHPTYVSKYWPLQGLMMAFGQVVLGHPFWGVWLSVGLMCAAITWMLQGWLGPGWALLGGFLAVIRLGTFSYWADSYWGGAVAAIGGALVLGALPRIKRQKRARYALLIGLGFAILAGSRPYEGLFFGIPVGATLLVWLWKMRQPDLSMVMRRVLTPLLSVLALTLIAIGYYFWRTTGSPFNAPYVVYEHTYNAARGFPWLQLKPVPAYRHKVFQTSHELYRLPAYRAAHTITGTVTMKLTGFLYFWMFFLGPVFTLPFLLVWGTLPLGFSWKDFSPSTRFLLLVCGITLAGEALPLWFYPHYAAPITCVILALVLIALRRVRSWEWHGKPSGMSVARSVPSICILLFILRVSTGITHWPRVSEWPRGRTPTWCSMNPMNLNRAAMLKELRRYSGLQLVILHYTKDHDPFFNEWVYNQADLKTAKVIWAHDMGPEKNQELINYFKHRHVWLVDADDNPPRLLPYPKSYGGS